MKPMKRPHLMIIDPAIKTAELDCFNRLAEVSPMPLTYHLPAIFGMDSIYRVGNTAKGIVIFGSSSSVNDRLPWQRALESWLMPKYQAKIPTLGICYGHQMIAYQFGAKVDFLFSDRHKLEGFETAKLVANPLWENTSLEGSLYVSHREVVTSCPKELVVTVTRPDVPIDGLAHKTMPIWTFQTHPEATSTFIRNLGDSNTTLEESFEFGHSLVQRFVNFVANCR